MVARLDTVRPAAQRLPIAGRIDRSRTLRFTFDGSSLEGYAGDTLASALVANGVRLVGRSFKYHRPRGVLTAGSEEPNALVELRSGARREPNTKAPTVELYDGLEAASQNRWPSLAFDVMAVNGLLSPLFVAGFYYKTFMWPAAFWERLYEPMIRRAAGLGRASGLPDPDAYEKTHAHCDLLVIGAGPAGLIAALAAGRSGAKVILAEEDFALGGRLLGERLEIDGRPGGDWADGIAAELAGLPNVRVLARTAVFGAFDDGVFAAIEKVADHLPEPRPYEPRQRVWQIVARRAVLAAGGIERPIAFGGNDRPGVMTASAVRTYLNRFAAAPGRRVAVFTTGDDGWKTAFDLADAGIEVPVLADARPAVDDALNTAARALGLRVELGAVVDDAHGGRGGLRAIDLRTPRGVERVALDTLAVSGGWNPNLGVTTHLGAKPVWSEATASFVPSAPPPWMLVAGAAGAKFALPDALEGGRAAAESALKDLGIGAKLPDLPRTSEDRHRTVPLWQVKTARGKAFVDLQHDVTVADVELSHREGFRAVEHLKRYTTLGMATDQGKSLSVVGQAIMADLSRTGLQALGTTMVRPPQVPVAIAALAGHHRGRHFRPERLPASHAHAVRVGAVFTDAGQWKRAQWFPQAGDGDWQGSVDREVLAVRGTVGICDVSTLGKIDIQGADAATFLDRVYANTFSTLAVGKVRYGLMLREDGFVMDDGTTARLGERRYVMSTTTANAGKVMAHLEFCHQVLWPELDVAMISVTEQWAQFAVAGPRSRELLQAVIEPGQDIANAAFPYMACGPVRVGGVNGRLFRVSFSGELAFEIAVPTRYGAALWEALLARGAVPYGTEALSVMRIEKGHAAGAELNGKTTAHDLGMGRLLSTKKDFIGRTLASRPALTDPARPRLVGLRPVERTARLRAGALLVPRDVTPAPEHDQGLVTSATHSANLGHAIALGLLSRGPERIGERVRAWDPVRGGDLEVEVCAPVFIDPQGAKLRG